MNSRNTWIWLGVAAGLFAFIFFYQRHLHKSSPGPVRILPHVKLSDVTSIQVRPASAGQAQLEIRAEHTNNIWRLTEPLPYPAQAASIEDLIAALEQLTPAIYITQSELKARPKADQEYGFTAPQASIILMQGDYRVHLLIGAKTSPGDQVYLQVVGVEGAYVVDADLLSHVPRSVNDWRDTSVINLEQSNFDRIAVTNSATALVRLVLQRDPTNRLWRMVWPLQARADNVRIEDSLRKLQNLHVRQFVSDEPKADLERLGLTPPELELSFGQSTNTLASLQFGKGLTNNPGLVYARRAGQNTIFAVSKEPLTGWRAAVNDFRDPHLLTLADPVEAIDVVAPEGSFSVQHQTNDVWRVLPDDLPADNGLVQDLANVLTGVPIAAFIKDVVSAPDLPDFGLATPLRCFIVRTGPANSSVLISNEVCFGLSTNQPDKVFAKATDENSVYAITTNDFARLPTAGWQMRERKLWHFSEEDVTQVTITQGGKTRQLVRRERYKWSLAPGSQGVVEDLPTEETVRGLVQASAVAWVARGEEERSRCGFSEKALQITLELKNGDKATIQFGGQAPSTNVYASLIIDGRIWICEFPWLLYRDVSNYLSIPTG